MAAKTAPRKPYNTVTAAAIRQHVATNIHRVGSAVDKLAAPIVSRLDELGAEVGERFKHTVVGTSSYWWQVRRNFGVVPLASGTQPT